jgi:dTDP-4-dehydrorhamnose reductase
LPEWVIDRMFEPMKILVTGSNGLLGQKLTDYYKTRKDIQLIATARGTDRYHDQSGYTYESLDITDEQQVKAILSAHKPDAVINTAAMTNVDACESDHEGCDALNVHAVKCLVDACNQKEHTWFIFPPISFLTEPMVLWEKRRKQIH